MAKRPKINQRQFAEVTAAIHASVYLPAITGTRPAPVDCVALLAYIQAAQAIYSEQCAIAKPTMKQATKKPIKKSST